MMIRGLGVVGAVHAGELARLQPAQKKILAVLMAAGPDGLSSDRFADEVWPDSLPKDWEGAVRQSISRMRRTIGLNTIVNSTKHYSLGSQVEVDIWELLDTDPLNNTLTDDVLTGFVTGEPYAGVEPSPMLRTSIDEITAIRIRILTHRSSQALPPPTALLDASRDFITQQPYREDVLVAAARLHIAAGLSAQVTQLLTERIDWLEAEIDGPIGAELFELHVSLLTDIPNDTDAVGLTTAPAQLIGNVEPPTAELRIERETLIDEASEQLASGGVVVTGQSGSGKTVLARNLVSDAFAEGSHVLWFTAQRDQSSAYGPLLAALPWLHNYLGPLLIDGGDPYSRSRCWSASLDALSRSFAGRPIVIVVDDAQWLDSHSQMFLEFLALARAARGLRLVVVGRPEDTHEGWAELIRSLTNTGLQTLIVPEFDQAELENLIGRSHPSLTSKQRVDLASAFSRAKATLPAIANELLRVGDPTTLFGPGAPASQQAIWTQSVSTETQSIAAAAAVVGLTFRLQWVMALTGISSEKVLASIDELLDAQLLIPGQRPDEFSFRHLLIHEGFEALSDRRTRRELHLTAARTNFGDDPHRKASHFVGAAPLVAESEVREALIGSARFHIRSGSFREAVQAFGQALEIASAPPEARELLDYANSMDLSGADGSTIREQAFKAAQAADDHDLSVEVAIGCAHETEDINGDKRRAALLDRVDLSQVSFDSLQSHRVALAREFSFLGEHDQSLELSHRVVRDANGPDGRCAGWLASWPTFLTTPVHEWPSLPADRDLATDAQLSAGMVQVECVRALMIGQDVTAREFLAKCSSDAMTQNPLRSWFASLLRSMVAFTDGDWLRSNEIADAGLVEAQRAGISSAFSARAAQAFAQLWTADKHGDLLPWLEAAAPDVQGSTLAEAAYVAALATDPERLSDTKTKLEPLVRKVAESGAPLAPATAALLAPATVAVGSPQAREALSSLVKPFAGTALVVGTGVSHLGPANRTLSLLAQPTDMKVALMTQAVQEADAWNLRVWSVRCRLDLHEITGIEQHRVDAKQRALGTDLAAQMFSD